MVELARLIRCKHYQVAIVVSISKTNGHFVFGLVEIEQLGRGVFW